MRASSLGICLIIATFATSVFALETVRIEADSEPNPYLSGFTTHELTAISDIGNIVGFDFAEVSGQGFFGPINTVLDDFVFNDYPGFFGLPETWVHEDSYFNLLSSQVLSIRSSKSSTSLHSVFVFGRNRDIAGPSVNFVRLVIADGDRVSYRGQVIIQPVGGTVYDAFLVDISGVVGVPEPSIWAILCCGIIGFGYRPVVGLLAESGS